ncbi:MAG: DUF6364 family protein [Candidatus Desantisbacteria bacterium]
MRTKLTLVLEKDIIDKAKIFAHNNNISISQIVSDYFITIDKLRNKSVLHSTILNEITGVIRSNKSVDALKKGYRNHLEEKYL